MCSSLEQIPKDTKSATVESFLKTYVRKIASAPQVDASFLARTYAVVMQESFGRIVSIL
jgi:hypothetical protein